MKRQEVRASLTYTTAVTGALTLLLSVGAATAANATDNPATAQSRKPIPKDQVEAIIVHAQRRSESLQKVPVSVTVISGTQLAARKLNELSQVTLAVPSLTIGQAGFYSVRGVGTLTGNPVLDSSVGVSVDEVSLGLPAYMSTGTLDDVSQIEVLSGPQGLLFGRNASAGLINILSNRPVIGLYGGEVSTEFDDRDTDPGGHFGGIARATANIPVSSTSALRLNVSEDYQDPIVKIVNPDPPGVRRDDFQHNQTIRGKYLWMPNEDLTVYLIADYSHLRGGADGEPEETYRVNGHGIENVGLTLDGITAGPNNLLQGANGAVYNDIDTGGVSLNLSYKLSSGLTLSNIAAWRAVRLRTAFDFDFTSAPVADNYFVGTDYNQYSDELRLAFKPDQVVDGQSGFYVFYQDQTPTQNLTGSVFTGIPNYIGADLYSRSPSRSLAGFSQINIHATPDLTFLLGGRVTNDDVSTALTQNTGDYTFALLGPRDVHVHQSYQDTNFSYRVGAQYQVRPTVMGYVTYGSGYKGPGYNVNEIFPNQNLVVQPETSTDLELGLKSTFFDRHLSLNIAAFIENFKDLQVENYDPQAASYINGNAGSARSDGVEITGVVRAFSGLTLNFGTTFQDPHFTSFPGDPCYIGQQLAGCAATGSFNGAGIPLPSSAKFTASLDANYQYSISDSTDGFIEGNFYHRSGINYSTAAAPDLRVGDSSILGFSTGLILNDRIRITLFCKNCTDKRVPSALFIDNFDAAFSHKLSIEQTWDYNSVRTIGLTASYKF